MRSCSGAEFDDVIGGTHRGLVVLDNEHGVAEITQAQQRLDQTLVVGRMQADAGLVQDVKHSCQSGTDLRGKTNALHLPTGKCAALAIQREITEPDLLQELDALHDLALQLAHIGFLLLGDFQVAHPAERIADLQGGELVDVEIEAGFKV